MSVYEQHFDQVIQPAERIIGHRTGVSVLPIHDRHAVTTDLAELDALVGFYNVLLVSDKNLQASTDTPFLLASKQELPAAPLISEMLSDKTSTVNLRNWLRTLRTMDTVMQRAEAGEPEPDLQFAVGEKWLKVSPEERLLGGVLHGYGLFVGHMAQPELPGGSLDNNLHLDKSDFLDALIETAAIAHTNGLPDNPVYKLSKKMSWFEVLDKNGNNLFSPFIRNLVEVSP